ncbi:p21-activated protein kinase-interacting protein 1-like [Galendromus occidentalis]|uniref:P21-activated protein kinase-interacting protein 1-like n=1 Tax=Galendromus occidentalis TaxID=34638 RepID=A0AAJ6QNQ3_9ACAR|nr:p21-activated protein kinase-interacting protein 1-like [Galendromus occidentalis]
MANTLMEGTQEFELVFGTYENFVVGYSFRRLQDDLFTLEQSFASPSHIASVRAVSSGGKFLASGSSDETIQLYNMRTRKEMGSLMKHSGTINALKFFKNSHLFSASDDGTICVWDTGSWQCLKTLTGHKQAVNDIAVHSSGKLLLSVSKDKTIYTWNLVKGRPAFISKLKCEASRVAWCPSETLFVITHGNDCDIFSPEVGGVVGSIDFGRRISDLTFIGDYLVLSGDEGKVGVFDLTVKDDVGKVAPSCIIEFEADPRARIKCVEYGGPNERMGCHYLATGTSEGVVSVWLLNAADGADKPKLLAKKSAGCRLTACSIFREE